MNKTYNGVRGSGEWKLLKGSGLLFSPGCYQVEGERDRILLSLFPTRYTMGNAGSNGNVSLGVETEKMAYMAGETVKGTVSVWIAVETQVISCAGPISFPSPALFSTTITGIMSVYVPMHVFDNFNNFHFFQISNSMYTLR
jgi:hypothetical protein